MAGVGCLHSAGRALLLLGLIAAAGCGASGEQRKPTFPVKGEVFVGGKPAVRAQVIFHPVTDLGPNVPRPTGEVAADGSFSLSTYTANDGAPAGEYTVTVSWPQGSSTIGGDAESGEDRLGGRFNNPKTSALKAKVNDGPTTIPPFQLKLR